MKKILITLIAVLIAGAISAQNTFKYEIKANGGITVGTGGTKIDSLVRLANTLRMFTGATELTTTPSAHTQGQTTITGLPDSLLNRYTKAQVNTRLNLKANTSHTQGQTTITALSDSLLIRYTKTQANTRFLGKSDTAGMLTPYINRNDTTAMLVPYVNRVDTAGMLLKYLRKKDGISLADSLLETEGGYVTKYSQKGIFNVRDYGAVSDDAISDIVAINDAIDAAYNLYSYSFGGGTVYIPVGVYLIDDTIHLRSNVSIRMERNTLLYTENYSGAVFVGDATVTHSYVHGGILFSGENTMIGISIRANASGQYMQECGFHDMTIQGCLTGIQFYCDNVGFINSNYFDNIWIEDFVNGIVAYEGASSAGLSGNNFNNLTLQCDDATAYGLKDIDLSYSTFTGLMIWDLPVAATAGITIRNGSRNVFTGGYWDEKGFSDTGLGNKFFTGRFIASPFRNTGTITAGTGITSSMINDVVLYSGGSAVAITANPQIAAAHDGQKIIIMGSSDTNTLTLSDGNGLILSGSCVLGVGDILELIYNKAYNLWVEVSRSNN